MEGLTSASSEYRMDEPTHSLLNGPVTHTGHLYESYACHDFKAEDEPSTTVTAGAPLTVEWDLEAKHPGDCSLYMSYDDDGGTYAAPKDWIKLAVFPGCVDQQLLESGGFDGGSPPKVNTWRVEMPSGCLPRHTPCSAGSGPRYTSLESTTSSFTPRESRPRCRCIQLSRSLALPPALLRSALLLASSALTADYLAPWQVLRRDRPGH